MAESSYPNPGVTQLQHERLLGRAMPSGLLGAPTDPPLVYADGTGTREIRIRASRQAVVDGYGWQNDATTVTKTLGANSSGQSRTDLVVLRLDRSTWTVASQVIAGTPGAGAPTPVTNTPGSSPDYYDLPLATVTVANGATTLAASTVTPLAWYLNADGQIVCTSSTLPPYDQGRIAYVRDAGRLMVGTGTSWLTGVEDSGTVSLAISSGFDASQNHVHRRNGWAFAELTFRRPLAGMNGGTAYTVAQLPAGFRPPWGYQTIAQCPSAQVTLTVAVRTDGYIIVNPGVDVPTNRAIVLSSMSHPVA